MIKVDLKPLSVNDAWKGRRYMTDEYKTYKKSLFYLLPQKIEIPDPPFEIHFEFGFSSSLSDWDNPIKPTQDIIAKKYGFNDKLIKKGVVISESVKPGKEYIKFKLLHYEKVLL